MKVKSKSFRLYSLFAALSLLTPSIASANPTEIDTLQKTNAVVVKDRKTGKVTFIGSNSANGIQIGKQTTAPGQRAIATPEGNARSFLRTYAPAFGVTNSDKDLTEIKSLKIDGLPAVKYQQRYNNIPIWGAQINVNLDTRGNLLSMGGETATIDRLDTVPKVAKAKAINTALQMVAKQYKIRVSELKISESELKIYQPGIVDSTPGKPQLVWFIKVVPKNSLNLERIEQVVLVDAQKPERIVLTFNNTPHARNRQTYYYTSGALPGTLVCAETTIGNNCVSPPGTNDTSKAHTYAADTYNFYRNYHGRDSINGYGMPLVSIVLGINYNNASWDGTNNRMIYGPGYARADDVVAHELTHGVTQYSSNLIYYGESGAINESFSDVWGEFVDLTNGKGNDSAALRWKIGEEVPGGAGRDMKNPPLYSQPDKITSPYYYTGGEDNAGVHTNSGVNNKAVYLMTDGGVFNGRTITGIGITKVAKIYYRAQTTLVTPGTNHYDLYNYINQSCNSLVGTSGITTSDCTQVRNALLAVQMNVSPATDLSICPAGRNGVMSFYDGLESTAKWQYSYLLGNNPWLLSDESTNGSIDGQYSAFIENVASATDTTLAMKTGVTIPSGGFLHFLHAYNLENGYDGGVLEYSIGNTNVWQDARPLFLAGQNYNGALSGSTLAGRSAFTGSSNTIVFSKYNLSSLAGKVVRFRFRQANDSSVGNQGWWQDNFRIYRCQ
ncbi:M4 family metallopeptidase [Merismopedia glauca]|uniref:Neutral metalloproteinase n=1 Tax=Merismopedia glauca CCAP 1448/3 TaxID=1296344 RepID=A0A2T1BY47_9CYAN|nr:M4 family metallopeptidase [Merismopedia glauca]PSB00956.1 hypothetical protein C7B64_20830 [Merismopedia glauca CCAP 1448/3]